MTAVWVALALGAVLSAGASLAMTARGTSKWVVRANHAGRPVPVVLGIALVAATAPAAIVAAGVGNRVAAGDIRGDILIGVVVGLWVVGSIDDALGGSVRGIGGHLRSALRGRPTTGILKLAAGLAAAVSLAVIVGGEPLRVVAAAVLIAVSTNLWNALDVVPGRALKWGIVALVPLVAVTWRGDYGLVSAGMLGASAGVLPFDLTERGMLGDAGSNPLGLVVGVGLALVLPTGWVVAAAAAGLLLQLAAETVTLSRLIDRVPPLRRFDRLGRTR